MPKYSRSHERAECAKISRGLWESLFGLIFSWLPGVGLILAIAGFFRQMVRMTETYKVRRAIAMAFAALVLIGCIGMLMFEAYQYSRDPMILDKVGLKVWQKVTGQENLPGAENSGGYEEEGDAVLEQEDIPEDVYNVDEGGEEGDNPVEEEGDNVGVPEGDFQDNIDFQEDDTDELPGGDEALSVEPTDETEVPEEMEAPEDAETSVSTLPSLKDMLSANGVKVEG